MHEHGRGFAEILESQFAGQGESIATSCRQLKSTRGLFIGLTPPIGDDPADRGLFIGLTPPMDPLLD